MQIKRLLDDRLVVTGDRLINSQGEHCELVEHANGQLMQCRLMARKLGIRPPN